MVYPRDHSPAIEIPITQDDIEVRAIWVEEVNKAEDVVLHSVDPISSSNETVVMRSPKTSSEALNAELEIEEDETRAHKDDFRSTHSR